MRMILPNRLKAFRWPLVAFFGATLLGCASVDQRYAGFFVVDKQASQETERIAVRITSCVTPAKEIICERRYGAFDECSLRCKTPPNRWVERPAGYGGYEDRSFTRHFLVLRSPSGAVQRVETSREQFDAAVIGQVLGTLPQTSTQVTDQKAADSASSAPDPASRMTSSASSRAAVSPQERPAPEQAQSVPSAMSMAEAQRRLARLGFDPGAPDGRLGPRTTAALRAFQRSIGLSVTGQLDEATRTELAKHK